MTNLELKRQLMEWYTLWRYRALKALYGSGTVRSIDLHLEIFPEGRQKTEEKKADAVEKHMLRLKDLGLVERMGKSRWGRWKITQDGITMLLNSRVAVQMKDMRLGLKLLERQRAKRAKARILRISKKANKGRSLRKRPFFV